MPAFFSGNYFYVDTYLWPCIISYPFFVRRRRFVVCRHVSLTNKSVPQVKKGCGTLAYSVKPEIYHVLWVIIVLQYF
jgi:hypothetical protein